MQYTEAMPERTRKPKDLNEWAYQIVQQSTADPESKPPRVPPSVISQVMSEMGRKGGKKGGKSRMAMLTPEQRSKLGSKAVRARWAAAAKRKAS